MKFFVGKFLTADQVTGKEVTVLLLKSLSSITHLWEKYNCICSSKWYQLSSGIHIVSLSLSNFLISTEWIYEKHNNQSLVYYILNIFTTGPWLRLGTPG